MSEGELSSTIQGSLNGVNVKRTTSAQKSNGDIRYITKSTSSNAVDTYDFSRTLGESAYMKVIRESQKTTLKKEKLAEQKHRILGMTFDGLR